mmetsp:Transcript_18679/g.38622  ORF Transcript_18679/g.38622 Transcript_18679/m.38622 type:complete len:221 (+) Transcript_18679:3332-3994(+)
MTSTRKATGTTGRGGIGRFRHRQCGIILIARTRTRGRRFGLVLFPKGQPTTGGGTTLGRFLRRLFRIGRSGGGQNDGRFGGGRLGTPTLLGRVRLIARMNLSFVQNRLGRLGRIKGAFVNESEEFAFFGGGKIGVQILGLRRFFFGRPNLILRPSLLFKVGARLAGHGAQHGIFLLRRGFLGRGLGFQFFYRQGGNGAIVQILLVIIIIIIPIRINASWG